MIHAADAAESEDPALLDKIGDYQGRSQLHKDDGEFDEVKYVQPRSLSFCREIFNAAFPEKVHLFEFATKSTNHAAICYECKIFTNDGGAAVKGEMDCAVLYRGVCIFTWEDKALNEELHFVKHQAQALCEVVSKAEKFHETTSKIPRTFCGVLTNGSSFVGVMVVSVNGGRVVRQRMLPTALPEAISKFFQLCFQECANLMSLIDDLANRKRQHDDCDGTVCDIQSDDHEDNKDKDSCPPDSKLQKFAAAGGGAPNTFSSSTRGKAEKGGGGAKKDAAGSSGSSRSTTPHDCFESLTGENLRRHNMLFFHSSLHRRHQLCN